MNINQKGFSLVEGLLIFIAISLVGSIGYFVYDKNNDSKNNEQANTSVSENDNLVQEEDDPAAEPFLELIDYGEEGISMYQKSDITKLKDASTSFKDFIASQLPEKFTKGSCGDFDDEKSSNFDVLKIAKDEFALGNVSCAGYVVWVKQDNKWSKVSELGGADYPLCSTVKKYNVPESIMSECNENGEIVKNTN